MSIEVELPDGTILDVDTDDPNVAASAAKSYLKKLQPPMGKGERFLQGVKDVSLGAEQLFHRALPLLPERAQAVDQRIGELNEQYRAPEGIDWMRMAGQGVATAPLAMAGGPGLMGAVRAGAMAGAVMPNEDTGEGFWEEKAMNSLLGAGTSGAAGLAVSGLGRMIAPKVQEGARELMKMGVTPTPGQLMGGGLQRTEGILESIPVLGDAIRSSKTTAIDEMNAIPFKRIAETLGAKPPHGIGREAMEGIEATVSDAFEKSVSGLKLQLDPGIINGLTSIYQEAKSDLTDDAFRAFDKHFRSKIVSGLKDGGADGPKLQRMISDLGRLTADYGRDPSAGMKQVGQYLKQARATLDDALMQQNPEAGPAFKAARDAFAQLTILRDAAQRAGSERGVFSPKTLDAAVRAHDKSSGRKAYASGKALMQDLSEPARTVLGASYPDSGTPARMFMGNILSAGTAVASPTTAMVAGLGMLPYAPGLRKLAAGAIAKRPAGAAATREALRKINPFLGIAAERYRDLDE